MRPTVISSTLEIGPYDEAFTLIVEPWADEFVIHPGQQCAVVAHHPSVTPGFGASLANGALIVWVNDSGATFSFLRDGVVEYETDNQIPPIP